jgi:hypothetical protein
MNIPLRPSTLQALEAFRRRRRRLLWNRAWLSLLTVCLAGLLLVALLDRVRFMPEFLRPWLALAVYFGGALAAWRVALRYLRIGQDELEAARLMESAAPALREQMLSAVELAHGHTSESEEFRARLQENVAAEVERLNLRKILPGRSLRPWLAGMVGLVALVVALSFQPALHLPGFLARAAVPFANLARPSNVKIKILEPQPASTLAPFSSEVEVAAEITGNFGGTAHLEVQSNGGKAQRREMRTAGAGRYETMVGVGQSDVRYRLIAGDAMTSWHTLGARARPRVTDFVKVITPPAYSGLPQKQLTESQGDIEALEGCKVQIALKTNQGIAKSALLLDPDQPNPPQPQPVHPNANGELQVEFEASSGRMSWQVALTAVETGFTNDESSPWQISVIPDLPPVVQITEPIEQVELLADEQVRLAGIASDDVGLASVSLAHAINGANWVEKEMVAKPGAEAQVRTLLPLGPLQVKAGDTVVLKLVAIDLKGQRSESTPVRAVILEQTVDPRQRQWAGEMRRLAQAAQVLNEEMREVTKLSQQVQKVQRQKRKPEEAARADDALSRAQTAFEQVKSRTDDLWEQLKTAARDAPTHLDAAEVQLLGEKVSQIRREAFPEMNRVLDGETENVDPLRKASAEAANHAAVVAQAAQAFAAEENARVVAQSAQHLQRQENLLTENALPANRDAAQRPQWQEQQRGAIAATESLRKELDALKGVVEGGMQRQLDELNKQVGEAATDLRESLDKADQAKSPEHLYGAADNLRQRLARTAATANAAAEQAANQAAQARDRLQKQPDPALAALEKAQSSLQTALAEAKDKRPTPPRQDREGRTALQRAEKELADAAKQLEDQAALREQTPMTNDQAALDTNRASRAADKLAQDVANLPRQKAPEAVQGAQEKAAQLLQASRALQADALAQNALRASEEAAANVDPTGAMTPTAPMDQARAAAEALRTLPEALRKMKTADPALPTAAQQAADATRAATDLLQALSRQSMAQPGQPLNTEPARQAAADAQQKASQLAAQMAEQTDAARQSLAQLTPDVSDMMTAVAEALQETQQETQSAAKDAEAEKPVADVADKAAALQPKTEANAEKMQSLQAALRQEANAADLANADQRQLARTADVALSQMQKKTPQIAQNLKQAMQATQSQPQAQALNKAAEAQQQTAEALAQLAQNMAKMEEGQALSEQELAAMQQMEQQLGVQEPLDEAYARAQALAQMAQDASQNPAAVLAELEKELAKNAPMQKALAELSKQTAQTSEQAVATEAQQPSNIGLAAEKAAHDLARVARHQTRLGQKEAAGQTAEASQQLRQNAQAAKGQPGQTQQPTGPQAQSAAAQAAKAAEAAAAATPPAPTANPFQQVQGAMLAQALDALDQTLNPMQGQSGQQQPQQGQGQQSAQQSLAGAQQQQQQQMASQRNQGQTPGQQMAQNSNQQPGQSENPGQPTAEGNMQAQLKDGVLAGELILVEGDWGHLPSKIAADLSEASRSEAAPEYRAAIESYYKAIATKAKR